MDLVAEAGVELNAKGQAACPLHGLDFYKACQCPAIGPARPRAGPAADPDALRARFVTADALATEAPAKPAWLIRGVLAQESPVFVIGEAKKAGKSTATLE